MRRRIPSLLIPILLTTTALAFSVPPGAEPALPTLPDPDVSEPNTGPGPGDVLATFTLVEGAPAFWDGPFVEHGFMPFGPNTGEELGPGDLRGTVDLCEWPGHGPCFRYQLNVVDPSRGSRLRIAIDNPNHKDKFGFELYAPDGSRARNACCPPHDTYEVAVDDPAAGAWMVKVSPNNVEYASFRMRALLEPPAEERGEPVPLLPNLRVFPPTMATFAAPLEGTGLTQAPLEVFGVRPASCAWDERIEDGATRCLRFDVGPSNVGDGPLDARFETVLGGRTSGNVTQRVHWSDGGVVERPAGSFVWHETHQHFHLDAYAHLGLHKVVDARKGTLAPAGEGHKVGFCLADVKIAHWETFAQDPHGHDTGDCGGASPAPAMGLSRGWIDIYHDYNSGNYVDFVGNGDGLYVIRVVVDAEGVFLETDEDDNVGYALVEVRGDEAWILERGLGADPWDPRKTTL